MKKIILASGSQARKNIISSLNIPFDIMPAEIDEKAFEDEGLVLRAEKIAVAKAEKIARTENAIVIAADTFCVHESGKVLEKPQTIEEAREMLQLQSGSSDQIISGFCYIDKMRDYQYSTSVSTTVHFRKFSNEEIDSYIKSQPVLTWSGAFYPGFPYGTAMIAEVSGSLASFLYGMPTEILIPELEKSGVKINAKNVESGK